MAHQLPSYVSKFGVTFTNAPVVIQRMFSDLTTITYFVAVFASTAAQVAGGQPVLQANFNMPFPAGAVDLVEALYADLQTREAFTTMITM